MNFLLHYVKSFLYLLLSDIKRKEKESLFILYVKSCGRALGSLLSLDSLYLYQYGIGKGSNNAIASETTGKR